MAIETETADDTEVEQDVDLSTDSQVDDVVDSSDATDGAAETTETESPATPDFGTVAKKYGFDESDPEKLFGNVAAERQRARQLEQQWLPHVQNFRAKQEAFAKWEAEQAKAAQQPAVEKRPKWEAPKLDPTWSQFIAVDPSTGLPTIREEFRPHVNPSILDDYNKRRSFERQTIQTIIDEPNSFFEKAGLYESVDERIARAMDAKFADYQSRQRAESFVQQHGDWLFEPQPDPVTGQKQLSHAGNVFNGYVNEAAELGILDPVKQEQYAMRALKAELYDTTPTTPETPATPAKTATQIRDEANGRFLKAANKAPGRGAATGAKDTRQVTSANFRQRAEELAADIPEDDWGTVPR